MRTLSVIVPVYNEQATIEPIIRRVLAAPLPDPLGLDLVLVDDCSTDQSWPRMQHAAAGPLPPNARVRLFRQPSNRGKGAAVRRGFAEAVGDLLLIQDADLEYDPADYPALLAPVLAGRADVVYGSRFLGRLPGRGSRRAAAAAADGLFHYLVNKVLTTASNLMTGLRLTDMETCYKLLTRQVLNSIRIESDGFDVEPELTARIARAGWRIREVPISYTGRGYAEGKKITWVDGLRAVRTIIRYRFFP